MKTTQHQVEHLFDFAVGTYICPNSKRLRPQLFNLGNCLFGRGGIGEIVNRNPTARARQFKGDALPNSATCSGNEC